MSKRITLLWLLLVGLFSTQANAASQYFSLFNQGENSIRISGLRWSGSYWPQFPAIIPAHTSKQSRIKEVLGRSAWISFTTIDVLNEQACFFSVTVGRSPQAVPTARGKFGQLPSCTVVGSTLVMKSTKNPDEFPATEVAMKFTNNTSSTVELSDVSWSGSYSPQFSTLQVAPDASVAAGLERKQVHTSQFSFNAIDPNTSESCFFTVTYNGDTLSIQGVTTSHRPADCQAEVENSTENRHRIRFTMANGDPAADTDEDGIVDGEDNCPLVANPNQENIDADVFGDACDDNIDGDDLLNVDDNCPLVANNSQDDFDGDLIGDACDDSDLDGFFDNVDNCPLVSNTNQSDIDEDGLGDVCDDSDEDGFFDNIDNCPLIANADQADLDGDLIGDACDVDIDGDAFDNDLDNCPLVANADQADLDGDLMGDVCDPDLDGDNFLNEADNCAYHFNPGQEDLDGDLVGDACDTDIDGDNFLNEIDNCPLIANPDQLDLDEDGLGNVCDPDMDGDTIDNSGDNCPMHANTDQADLDGDLIGDVCDSDIDGDTFANDNDCAPYDSSINPDATEILNNGIDENCTGLTDDTITGAVQPMLNTMAALPNEDFATNNGNGKGNGNNKKKQFEQHSSQVIAHVDAEHYTEALQAIDKLLFKTDGCINDGTPDSNDWINHCDSQTAMYQSLAELKKIILASF